MNAIGRSPRTSDAARDPPCSQVSTYLYHPRVVVVTLRRPERPLVPALVSPLDRSLVSDPEDLLRSNLDVDPAR